MEKLEKSIWSFVKDLEWNILCIIYDFPEADDEDKLRSAFRKRIGKDATHRAIMHLSFKKFLTYNCEGTQNMCGNLKLTTAGKGVVLLGRETREKLSYLDQSKTAAWA
jgi:hypothetical protein